ncbi:hypothetical protein GCM10009605_25130 [Nocardiopsis composta]
MKGRIREVPGRAQQLYALLPLPLAKEGTWIPAGSPGSIPASALPPGTPMGTVLPGSPGSDGAVRICRPLEERTREHE